MHFTSVLSELPDTEAALEEVLTQVTDSFYPPDASPNSGDPDLIVVFFSAHHSRNALYVGRRILQTFPRAAVVGCSAGGVVAARREIEGEPALGVTAARLPGVACHVFQLEPDELPAVGDVAAWRTVLEGADCIGDPSGVLLLPDPFTVDVQTTVDSVQAVFPGVPVMGGVASGARLPGQTRLLAGNRGLDRGVVGLVLSGNLVVDTVVAQGCRPIGQPMFVTRCEANLIHTLDGRSAADVIEEIYGGLSDDDQLLFRAGVFVGLVMSPTQERYERGDFLVRNVLGFASDSPSALAVASTIEPNTVVQFQLRDAATSAEDLTAHLRSYASTVEQGPAGGLMFACLGRGRGLYGSADHDSSVFFASLGDVPLGGFFCNGEIGPVQGAAHVHGYTSAFALFRPASELS